MTPFIKHKELNKKWVLINGANAVVGRLAATISKILRGKNKAQFNTHEDNGDFVVVTNAEKIVFTGKKHKDKKYYRHTGHPGGIKFEAPSIFKSKGKPEEILRLAVKRMMPLGPMSKKQMTKLKIYKGDKHPHDSQKIIALDFAKANKQNYRN